MVLPPPLPLPLLLLVITYMEESGGRGKGLSSLRGGGGKAMGAASAEAAEAEATAEGGGDTSFPFYMPGARAGGEAYPPQRHGWRWRRTCGILNQARLFPPLVPCSFLETGRNGEAGEGGGGDAKICGRRRSDAALN